MFSLKDIAAYYNQTQHHYQLWWNLDRSLAVHYGFWNEETANFAEALNQTNKEMAQLARIQEGESILDAGCGVGGAARFLCSEYNACVEGITLSEKQLTKALEVKQSHPHLAMAFSLQDFSHTSFPDQHFDVVWACESSCHASSKSDFLKESFRVLKSNGRLVIADYFTTGINDQHPFLRKWANAWAIDELHQECDFLALLETSDFKLLHNVDVTKAILPSARRMYWAAIAAALPSEVYNMFHNASVFGRRHYVSGYYQFRALQKGLWKYRMIVAQKT